MEKIKKRINIGEYKNWFETSSGSSLSWGDIAYDYYLGDSREGLLENLATKVKEYDESGETIGEHYIARRGTIIRALRLVKDFFGNAELYRLCKRKDYIFIRVKEYDFYSYSADTPDVSLETFFITGERPYFDSECVEVSNNSYVNVNEEGEEVLCTESSITANYINVYDFEEGEIVSHKRYFIEDDTLIENDIRVGDYVIVHPNYEKFLKLFGGDAEYSPVEKAVRFVSWVYEEPDKRMLSEEDGEMPYIELHIPITQEVNEFGIPNVFVETWVSGKKYGTGDEVLYNGEIFTLAEGYEETPYYGTTPPPDDSNWVANDEFYNLDISGGSRTITGITESRLRKLQVLKKSYDKSGNTLPFIEDGDNGGIPYKVNVPINVCVQDDDVITYDKITEITFLNESGETVSWDAVDDSGMVLFTYYCGNSTTDANDFSQENGICFREYYCFDIKKENFELDGDSGENEYTYASIDYYRTPSDEEMGFITEFYNPDGSGVTGMEEIKMSHIGNTKNSVLTRYEFETNVNNKTQIAHYFFDEGLIGYQDTKINVSKVKIERGKYAAFERHNALGEVSSFDDLEKYKNGFFKLKDNENY